MPIHQPAKNIQDALAKRNRLLLALVRKEGGEIRIRAADVDSINDKAILMSDWDPATGEIVLRSGSQFAEFQVVEPEQYEWTRPVSERKAEVNPEPPRSAVLTNEQVAQIEDGLRRRAAARRETQAANSRNSEIRNLS